MAITVNGVTLNDGDPLLVGGVQAQEVTVNGVSAWKNTVAPSAITNFAASDDQNNQVTVTFTAATGIPAPVHDLYENDVLAASAIDSGHVFPKTGPFTGTYHVKAVNVAGTTPSNSDSGTSLKPFANSWTGDSRLIYSSSVYALTGAGTGFTMEFTVFGNVDVTPLIPMNPDGTFVVGAYQSGSWPTQGFRIVTESTRFNFQYAYGTIVKPLSDWMSFDPNVGFENKTITSDTYGIKGSGYTLQLNDYEGVVTVA